MHASPTTPLRQEAHATQILRPQLLPLTQRQCDQRDKEVDAQVGRQEAGNGGGPAGKGDGVAEACANGDRGRAASTTGLSDGCYNQVVAETTAKAKHYDKKPSPVKNTYVDTRQRMRLYTVLTSQ